VVVEADAPDLRRNVVGEQRRDLVERNGLDSRRIAHMRSRLNDREQIVGRLEAVAGVDQLNGCDSMSRDDAGVAVTLMIEADEFHNAIK
jgi:hypothetical protein